MDFYTVLDQAVDLLRPLQAHCHRGLGMLYGTLGQQEQARRELSTAIEMYRTMAMTLWAMGAPKRAIMPSPRT
jgi:Flp pilus assembly protein TadD